MKVSYHSNDGRMSVELDGEQKEVFNQIAAFQEVFEHTKCLKCGNEESLRFVVRNVDDNDFYEVHCQNPACRARLAFGSHKKGGTLFPKKKDAEGNWLPHGGWTKFNAQTGKEE